MEDISVHYNEIALKGRNRREFEKLLDKEIYRLFHKRAERLQGRLLLRGLDEKEASRLAMLPGVAWFGKTKIINRDLEKLKKTIKDLYAEYGPMRIDVRRIDKTYDRTSLEVRNYLIKEAGGDENGQRVRVEIFKDSFVINYNISRGLGGLPIDPKNKVLSLFSGGIDSSVVPFELMKRGMSVDLLHVHAFNDPDLALNSKIRGILEKISEINDFRLYLVPFYVFSIKASAAPPRYELVLFKRFLLKLAERLSKEGGYKAIATGDSLSQVASQTLDNLSAESAGIDTLILRPFTTLNKEDIIRLAEKYGTYDLSIQPYKDCCSIVSRHPSTNARAEMIDRLSKEIDLDGIVDESIKQLKVMEFPLS
ncbi:MAG: tRNA sulfurtransferase [Candidatus Acidifodinimicrobium sp.]